MRVSRRMHGGTRPFCILHDSTSRRSICDRLHSESRPTLSLSNPYEINLRYSVEGLIPRISEARFFWPPVWCSTFRMYSRSSSSSVRLGLSMTRLPQPHARGAGARVHSESTAPYGRPEEARFGNPRDQPLHAVPQVDLVRVAQGERRPALGVKAVAN